MGGVALFLFGMSLMGDGLKKVAGNKLEVILYKLSNTTMKGVLLGTGVTAVIQSSSATSVMVVGFVNSGMMKKRQALSIIHGSLIGTSITGWIICLSSIEGAGGWTALLSTASISAIVAVIGIILRMFVKGQTQRHVGDIMLGFSVLMFGMQAMSSAVSPLRSSEAFLSMLTTFSNPVVGMLVGAAFTAVLQSASASVGILQALSMTGAITFDIAFPIILGIAVGASFPVLLSAIGAQIEGRRTAFSYLFIELIAVSVCAALFYGINAGVGFTFLTMVMTPVTIALVNTIFRVAGAILLTPFNPQMERLVDRVIKEKKVDKPEDREFSRLDERFLNHPSVAIDQSRITVNAMAQAAWNNIVDAISLLNDYDEASYELVMSTEDLVDKYEDAIGTYLMRLSSKELDKKQGEDVSRFLYTLNDFERISDHAVNLADNAKELTSKHIHFAPETESELKVLSEAVKEILSLTMTAFFQNNINQAKTVEPLEERIDVLCDTMKLRHTDRLQRGENSLQHGFIFNDLLTNFERVADHCSNVAIALIELNADEYDTHEYLIDLKKTHSEEFAVKYEEFASKYAI